MPKEVKKVRKNRAQIWQMKYRRLSRQIKPVQVYFDKQKESQMGSEDTRDNTTIDTLLDEVQEQKMKLMQLQQVQKLAKQLENASGQIDRLRYQRNKLTGSVMASQNAFAALQAKHKRSKKTIADLQEKIASLENFEVQLNQFHFKLMTEAEQMELKRQQQKQQMQSALLQVQRQYTAQVQQIESFAQERLQLDRKQAQQRQQHLTNQKQTLEQALNAAQIQKQSLTHQFTAELQARTHRIYLQNQSVYERRLQIIEQKYQRQIQGINQIARQTQKKLEQTQQSLVQRVASHEMILAWKDKQLQQLKEQHRNDLKTLEAQLKRELNVQLSRYNIKQRENKELKIMIKDEDAIHRQQMKILKEQHLDYVHKLEKQFQIGQRNGIARFAKLEAQYEAQLNKQRQQTAEIQRIKNQLLRLTQLQQERRNRLTMGHKFSFVQMGIPAPPPPPPPPADSIGVGTEFKPKKVDKVLHFFFTPVHTTYHPPKPKGVTLFNEGATRIVITQDNTSVWIGTEIQTPKGSYFTHQSVCIPLLDYQKDFFQAFQRIKLRPFLPKSFQRVGTSQTFFIKDIYKQKEYLSLRTLNLDGYPSKYGFNLLYDDFVASMNKWGIAVQ